MRECPVHQSRRDVRVIRCDHYGDRSLAMVNELGETRITLTSPSGWTDFWFPLWTINDGLAHAEYETLAAALREGNL